VAAVTPDEYFSGVCRGMGWEPTPWRLAAFAFWATREGMPFEETWNPLATTMTGDLNPTFNKGYGPGNWNSVPVRVYRTPEAGITATVETLQSDTYYHNIQRCFRDQTGYQDAVGPRDFTSWVGSVVYGQQVVDFMKTCTESKEALMDPKRLWLMQIATGSFSRMVSCYGVLQAANLFAADEATDGIAQPIDGKDDLNDAEIRRWRILGLACSDRYQQACALLGNP
jgi:hypothetical protein